MKRLALIALSTFLVACSSNDSVDLKPMDLVNIESEREVQKKWSKGIGKGSGSSYSLLTATLIDDQICAVDHQGYASCLNTESGKKNWAQDLELPISGATGSGSSTGEVIALNSANGEIQWRVSVSSEILSAPQSNGKVVAVQTLDGNVFGLDAKTGKQIWLHDNVLPTLTLRGTATPVATPSVIYAGFATGKVTALDANEGTVIWEQRVAIPKGRSELERVIDIDGAPLVSGNLIFAVSYQGRIVALDRNTGRGIWAKDESSHLNLSTAMGYVFVTNSDDKVRAYSSTTGQLVWENDQMQRRTLSAPQVFGEFVAVGDSEGYVHIMNQQDGQIVARRKVDGAGIRAPMMTANEVLYVYGNSGDLEALSIQ